MKTCPNCGASYEEDVCPNCSVAETEDTTDTTDTTEQVPVVESPEELTDDNNNKDDKGVNKGLSIVIILIALAMLVGVIGIVMKTTTPTPLMSITSDSKVNNAPIMYFVADPTDEKGGGSIHVNGQGMSEEAIFNIDRLSMETKLVPLIASNNGQYFAYISADKGLYFLTLKELSGTTMNESQYRVAENVADVLAISEEGLLYFLNTKDVLCVYDGTSVTEIDEDAQVIQMSTGELQLFPMDGKRVVYTAIKDDKQLLQTFVVGTDKEPTTIAETSSFSVTNQSAKSLVYYTTEEKPQKETKSKTPVPPQLIIRGYSYHFDTKESKLLSEKIGQILWSNHDDKYLYIDVFLGDTPEDGYQLNLCYSDGGVSTTIAENLNSNYHLSENNNLFIYDTTDQKTGETTFYGIGFKDGLTEGVEIYKAGKEERVSFTSSLTEPMIYLLKTKQGETKSSIFWLEQKKDKTFTEPVLIDDQAIFTIYQQMNGKQIYMRNISSGGEYADLYLAEKSGPKLLVENVWTPSIGGVPALQSVDSKLVVISMKERIPISKEPKAYKGDLVTFENGKKVVLAEDMLANDTEHFLPVYYRNPKLMYFIMIEEGQQGGKLYRYTGQGEPVVVSENVINVL